MFGIDDAISSVSTLATTVITRVWPDATEIEKAKLAQMASELQGEINITLAQLKINEVEAGSSSFFVAGWRPAVGWVGVASLLYSGVGISLLSWAGAFFGLPPLPIVDSSVATNILFGMLGIGGMRTYEKINGVETKKVSK